MANYQKKNGEQPQSFRMTKNGSICRKFKTMYVLNICMLNTY